MYIMKMNNYLNIRIHSTLNTQHSTNLSSKFQCFSFGIASIFLWINYNFLLYKYLLNNNRINLKISALIKQVGIYV